MNTTQNHDDLIMKVGTNQIEILEFFLEKEQADGGNYRGVFGINVSKVLEVIRLTTITEVPHVPHYVIGMIHLRGLTVPVISLAEWLGMEEPKIDDTKKKVIIAEFNNIVIGFVVHQTTRIRRIAWGDINVPPEMTNEKYGGSITGTTKVEDGRILLILDLEKVVADLTPNKEDTFEIPQASPINENHKKSILVVDDSLVARKQVMMVLKKGNYDVITAVNGKEAWQCMQEIYATSQKNGIPLRELIYLVLTDVEMPVMDGYTLTRKIKEDDRFNDIPVIMHSSLSGKANVSKGKQAGCDKYCVKFIPELLFETISEF